MRKATPARPRSPSPSPSPTPATSPSPWTTRRPTAPPWRPTATTIRPPAPSRSPRVRPARRSWCWSTGTPSSSPTEPFFVILSEPTSAPLAHGQALAPISTDHAPPTITINDVARTEGNTGPTPFVFTVTLSNPSYQPVTVHYATADGTATT